MIRITQLRLPVEHSEEDLNRKIVHELRTDASNIRWWRIARRSIDARDKSNLRFVYTIDAEVKGEKKIASRSRHNNIMLTQSAKYHFPAHGDMQLEDRPLIIGSGPAGLFCTWMLAKYGYRPILLERGEEASERRKTVDAFWKGGKLDPDSNVQFGEGGAGTFSDGKLNTGVKDAHGRNQEVLRIFVQAGAPEEILYDAKPHLGTDLLVSIVQRLREQIISYGGEVHFRTRMESLLTDQNQVRGVHTNHGDFYSPVVVLAIGHSARDTFSMLSETGIQMQAKPFAVGLRVEHPQALITLDQYGPDAPDFLGPAPYKVTKTLENGRGVYSFCMCPGGFVVNASSEENELAVNGMSYHDRASGNANSAIVVTVRPEDYLPWHQEGTSDALNGMYFQRALERRAFEAGEGEIPLQRFEDFCENRKGGAGSFSPCTKGGFTYANVRGILPAELSASIEEGMHGFDQMIPGFGSPDVLLSGVESRTSSPVRISRDEQLQSSICGLYPCGEGAGYAGGITSAAMDGLKVAEAIGMKYMPF